MTESRFQLSACCGCFSLRFGTICVGIGTVILSIIAIVLAFTWNVHWKTFLDFIDVDILKWIYAFNLVMTIFVTTAMTTGAIKKMTRIMFPWIVLGIVLLISLVVSVIVTSIYLFINDKELYHIQYGFLYLIGGLLIAAIYGYFWLVVYSYFQQLRQEKSTIKVGPYGRPYSYQRP